MDTRDSLKESILRFGLTEVYTPPAGAHVDVVFIHGLNGHPYLTWVSQKQEVFWPAQLLPVIIDEEQARVMVFGYDADITSFTGAISEDRIHNHAEYLVAQLWANRRRRKATETPIVFVAHSLGGLLVKRALIYSSGIRGHHTQHLRSIFVSTFGILFLGTPHRGFDSAGWNFLSCNVGMRTPSTENRPRLFESLKPNSETLQHIDRDFIQLATRFHLYFFHEGKPTHFEGAERYIVSKESASPNLRDVERASIQQDHSDMCKFESLDAPGFTLVAEAIQRYASEAPALIVRRWDFERAERHTRIEAEVDELVPGVSGSSQRSLPGEESCLLDREDEICLQDLRLTDPRHDKKRLEDKSGGLLHGSYRWMIDNAEFRRWQEDQQIQLFWIKGNPGKGKTMLLCGIIDELQKLPALSLSFFFCQATDSRINSGTAVLRGLIYLLVDQQPSLISHVRRKYDRAGKSLFRDTNAWIALCEVFTDILQDPCLNDTYVVVDALDECVTELPQLLALIVSKSSTSSKIKWLVSSRNELKIEEMLQTAVKKVKFCLESNTEYISKAVRFFIQDRVHRLVQLKKYDHKTENLIRDHLSSNSNDTFLWVALVCRNLEAKGSRWKVLKVLKESPPGLDSLYRQMTIKINTSDEADLLRWILALLTIVRRPLRLKELMIFVEKREPISNDLGILAELIGQCGSFLDLQDDTVYFVHESAKDFLLEKFHDELYPLGVANLHSKIFTSSLEVMTRALHRDMYNLQAPGYPVDQVHKPDSDPLTSVGYSCVYWVEHLTEWDVNIASMDRNSSDNYGAVYNFLSHKFLYWLEALSLLRCVSEGLLSIVKLDRLLKENPGISQLIALVQDARRFVLYHRATIESHPLQIYVSALVLTPTDSLIKRLSTKEIPKWITMKPAMIRNWSNCLQRLETQEMPANTLAFSPDGRLLASAASDTIYLWNPTLGTLLHSLKATSIVVCLAFSPGSEWLASASEFNLVELRDPNSGLILQTFKTPDSVESLAFSRDGKLLLCTVHGKMMELWDLKLRTMLHEFECFASEPRYWPDVICFSPDGSTIAYVLRNAREVVDLADLTSGAVLQTLQHESEVQCLALSPCGTMLASISNYTLISLWNIKLGVVLNTATDQYGGIYDIAYSPNCRLIASASAQTVRLWDAGSGELLKSLEGHIFDVSAVTFSPDGKLLASISIDGTIRLWDIDLALAHQRLPGWSSCVTNVAFSPSGKLLAVSLQNGGIELWDTDSGVILQDLCYHENGIKSMKLSPEGRLLASLSYDKDLLLWDTESGDAPLTLAGPDDFRQIEAMAFSPKAPFLALASVDKTVKIWHTGSKILARTLEGHSNSIPDVIFSPDGKVLASASRDMTIRMWDPESGAALQTLSGHTDSVLSVVFSPDNEFLVSASADNAIIVWKAELGEAIQKHNISDFYEERLPRIRPTLSFSPNGTLFLASRGPMYIAPFSPYRASAQSKNSRDIFVKETWVALETENLLILHPDFRPTCSAVHGPYAAIGHISGRVSILKFDLEAL